MKNYLIIIRLGRCYLDDVIEYYVVKVVRDPDTMRRKSVEYFDSPITRTDSLSLHRNDAPAVQIFDPSQFDKRKGEYPVSSQYYQHGEHEMSFSSPEFVKQQRTNNGPKFT